MILAWRWKHDIGTVPSILHLKVKFPTKEGVMVMRGNQKAKRASRYSASRSLMRLTVLKK